MSLKVIGGLFKGRNLKAPSGALSKPTTSILRKAVFDICQQVIEGTHFLDLFACSGAMGIEALSRGASFATFIEQDRRTSFTLKENIELLSLQNQTKLICADVFTAIKKFSAFPYQVIYIDPPYHLAKEERMSDLLRFLDLNIKGPCVIFIEEGFPSHLQFPEFSHLQYKKSRRFGATSLHELYID